MTAHIPFHPELTIHHPVRPRAGHAGRLVAIVVTHNRITQLRTTVLALLADPADRLHALVVVNNASTDDSADWLDSQPDPRLHVLHLNRNIGGAGGFAAGLDHARRSFDPDWFVLMDDDARPRPDALQVFHSSDLAGWDAIAGAAYHPHGAICDINRPTLDPFSNWRKFLRTLCAGREGFHLNTTAYAQKSPVQVDGASFVGLFLSRRAITLGGLPEHDLFIYGDDALQTLRLSRAGGRIAFLPTIEFEHDTSTNTELQNTAPLWKVYYRHRNTLILYHMAAGWLFWPICLVVIPRWVLRSRDYPGQRMLFLKLFLRAIRDGLRGRRKIEHDKVLQWAGDLQ